MIICRDSYSNNVLLTRKDIRGTAQLAWAPKLIPLRFEILNSFLLSPFLFVSLVRGNPLLAFHPFSIHWSLASHSNIIPVFSFDIELFYVDIAISWPNTDFDSLALALYLIMRASLICIWWDIAYIEFRRLWPYKLVTDWRQHPWLFWIAACLPSLIYDLRLTSFVTAWEILGRILYYCNDSMIAIHTLVVFS